MPYRFAWALDQTGPLARSAFHHLLDCLTTINANYLRAHPEAPTLAASKVQFLPEAQGQDDWLDIPSTLYLGTGDSEDLVTWRAAEIRARENVQARAVVLPNGRLVVQRPNGQIEDVLPPNAPPVVIGDLLRRVIFRLDLFNGPWEMDLSRKALDAMLLALFRIDVDYLRANPSTPGIYQSGLDYREEPMGQEEWQDIPTALKMGIGDCLPASTQVLRDDYSLTTLSELRPGDRIMGDSEWTTIVDGCMTGEKPVYAVTLSNGCTLRATGDHRVFATDGTELRVKDLRVGQRLKTPSRPFPVTTDHESWTALTDNDFAWLVGTYIADGWIKYAVTKAHGRIYAFCISGDDAKPKRRKAEQKLRTKVLCEEHLNVDFRWNKKWIEVRDAALGQLMASCGGTAPFKKLWSMKWSQEQVSHLLEGLQTDSSTAFNRTKTATYGTTSRELAIQLRVLHRMVNESVHIRSWSAAEHRGLGQNAVYRIGVRSNTYTPKSTNWVSRQQTIRSSATVRSIALDGVDLCADIKTTTGKFYLPECDLIVHNCEDLASWRAAEILVREGRDAKPFFSESKRPNGGVLFHIRTVDAQGRVEDPSYHLGMR